MKGENLYSGLLTQLTWE